MQQTLDQPKTESYPPTVASRRKAFLAQWAWISLFWVLIALAALLETYWSDPDSLRYYSSRVAMQWLPWILLTPVVMWLTSRFTLERATWQRNIWIHLLAGVLIVGGLATVSYFLFVRPYIQMGRPYFRGPDTAVFIPNGPGGRPEPGTNTNGTNFFNQRPEGRWPGRGMDWPDHNPNGGPGGGRGFGGGWPPPRGDNGYFGPPGPGPGPFSIPWRMGPTAAMMILGLSTWQLPTFCAVLGMAHALVFYQRARDRERRGVVLESRLNQARLQALRMQMNPHFLFNTLNSISSLVYDKPKVADEMITSLSDLLRLTLNTTDRQEVTLREELDFLDQYLFIEQTRFGDRLKIERNIEPVTLGVIVPSLILQPLVENAFKHGVEAQLGPGVIQISAKRAGTTLLLEVADNGHGVPPDTALREGVGLSNTRARLKGLYGDRGSMDYGPRPDGGFRVIVQIPWHTEAIAPPPPTRTA